MRTKLIILAAIICIVILVLFFLPERQCMSGGIFPTQADAEYMFKRYEEKFEIYLFYYTEEMAGDGSPVQMWICNWWHP